MLRIVREEGGVHPEHPERPAGVEPRPHLNGLAFGQGLGRGPRAGAEGLAVAQELEAVSQQRGNGFRTRRQHRWLEQPLDRLDAQVVRHVEDMRDDRDVEGGRIDAHVDIAERNRMSRGRRRDAQQRERNPMSAGRLMAVNGNVREG